MIKIFCSKKTISYNYLNQTKVKYWVLPVENYQCSQQIFFIFKLYNNSPYILALRCPYHHVLFISIHLSLFLLRFLLSTVQVQANITDLHPLTEYTFRLRGLNSYGYSNYSNPVVIVTQGRKTWANLSI